MRKETRLALSTMKDEPEGHVTRSRGFRQKVTENPHMDSDNRNLALVGTTDGVPFFDDQIRGCWPFFFGTIPSTLCRHSAAYAFTLHAKISDDRMLTEC